jgi:hypothetical protein
MGISRNRCILWDGFIWRSKDDRLVFMRFVV